jgi:hypothetical protein
MPKLSKEQQQKKIKKLLQEYHKLFPPFLELYESIRDSCSKNLKEFEQELLYEHYFTEEETKKRIDEEKEFLRLFKKISVTDLILKDGPEFKSLSIYMGLSPYCFKHALEKLNNCVRKLIKCKNYKDVNIVDEIDFFEKKELKTSGRELIKEQISMSLPKIPVDIIKIILHRCK